ncbi:MAG: hypothetical protein OEX00_03785, partial [Gammaproteobacteria bacterium]|nr:hypothetical protein [Gammaproteobacteria bacterium]
EVFYSDEYKPQQADLFSAPAERTERTATPVEFENYVKKRLDSVFNYVHEPVGLPKTGAQLYSLFLCVSNPNRKAIDLAKRVARDIIRNS